MLEQFLQFWSFNDPNVGWVLCGSVLLGAAAAVIGTFAFLQRKSLAGDALAHAALPGVTTAFLIFQSRSPAVILGGAIVSCIIGYMTVEFLTKKTKIKEDSALAIVLSLFFAIGIFQLTIIQKLPNAAQAGLDKLLFGQAAAIVKADLIVLAILAFILLLFVITCFRELRAITFDRSFSLSLGMNVQLFDMLLAAAIVLAVVIGLQLVGVVLMAALLLTPPAAARFWSDDLKKILLLSGIFGALSGVAGSNISYLAPRMPTGPWMVVAITTLFLISFLFAPRKGYLAQRYQRVKLAQRMLDENLLRTLYKLAEQARDFKEYFEPSKILAFRDISTTKLNRAISRLIALGLVTLNESKIGLSATGLKRAALITRYHRLWELYLTERVNIASDHVHDDAEEIEHILNPELAEQLAHELGLVGTDPHGKVVPKEVQTVVSMGRK